MTTRIQRREILPPANLPDHLPPLLARVYRARNVTEGSELDYSLSRLLPFNALQGMDQATDLLTRVATAQGAILVVGDFDADGATSSALMVRGLRAMGAQQVDYLVPNRFEFGYGLTPEIVAVAETRCPDLIVTVDNGISSLNGVAEARRRGIAVLITDHHLPGDSLPDADAIVNPNQPGDDFPSKHLAGVGVTFYLLAALRARLRQLDWFSAQGIAEPNLGEFLDLVALGTVADLVPLDHNNRLLVAQGLERIRRGRGSAGIRALAQVAGRDWRRLVSGDLAFALAPRLNAAGRLEDMSLGIECLLCQEPERALALAQRLDALNRERRRVEAEMQTQALDILEAMDMPGGATLPFGLCLYDRTWHEGVVGIVASRIKERFGRPVIAFARAGVGEGMLKGSARSVPGLHIRDALDSVATRFPELVARFGGHAMAAGLSLAESNLERFREAFDQEVRRHLQATDLHGILFSDGPLEGDQFNLELAETLRLGGPWGQGFPEPLFDGRFDLMDRRVVGGKHLKMRLRHPDSRQLLDAIAFNTPDDDWPPEVQQVRLAYRLDVNEYRQRRTVQLVVEHVEPVTA